MNPKLRRSFLFWTAPLSALLLLAALNCSKLPAPAVAPEPTATLTEAEWSEQEMRGPQAIEDSRQTREAKRADDDIRKALELASATPGPTRVPPFTSYDPPCGGTKARQCLEPTAALINAFPDQNACDGDEQRVCIVPMGAVGVSVIEYLSRYFSSTYGLNVRVLAPVTIRGFDDEREQVNIDAAGFLLASDYEKYITDSNVTLIGIMPVDLYTNRCPACNWVFASRSDDELDGGYAIISSFRMNPRTYGDPEDDDLLEKRLRKMVGKYIAIMRYGLLETDDPRSIMFGPITSLEALDFIDGEIPLR